jgi:hypothetical protein
MVLANFRHQNELRWSNGKANQTKINVDESSQKKARTSSVSTHGWPTPPPPLPRLKWSFIYRDMFSPVHRKKSRAFCIHKIGQRIYVRDTSMCTRAIHGFTKPRIIMYIVLVVLF